MANLLPPRIKGPVSECSTQIWVQGQFPGATVEVVDIATGTVVATGPPATSPDQTFPKVAALVPGHKLAARQTLGTDASGPSADTVEVQKRPNLVGPVSFVTPLVECARCLFLEGLVPGAKVEVDHFRASTDFLGEATATGDSARVADNTRKLADLEQAVKRIEALLKMGPPGTPIPLVAPNGKHGGEHETGHNHGSQVGGHEH